MLHLFSVFYALVTRGFFRNFIDSNQTKLITTDLDWCLIGCLYCLVPPNMES